jgi:hypothetical protein
MLLATKANVRISTEVVFARQMTEIKVIKHQTELLYTNLHTFIKTGSPKKVEKKIVSKNKKGKTGARCGPLFEQTEHTVKQTVQ